MSNTVKSLWGEEFDIILPPSNTKKVIEKLDSPLDPNKVLKSKKTDIYTKLDLITKNVYEILGQYKDNTVVIKSKEELHDYISKAIINDIIAIDTETNRSLDPLTCILMGGCIYTPGEKNAYIPINHTDLDGNRLYWQLTEQDLKEEFSRLSNTKIIMHNGSFDYQVIKCTCDIPLKIYWDTMVGARLLNENEKAALKSQYVEKIDASIEKYSIESFFKNIDYNLVSPEIFALYAATDAYMTYKLYVYQRSIFDLPENKRLLDLMFNIEVPIITVAAEMELTGVEIDQDYAKRLATHYRSQLSVIDSQINAELNQLKPEVDRWRLTPEANEKPIKKGWAFNDKTKFWYNAKTGKIGEVDDVVGKSKSEQLEYPIKITSSTQLAILMYDVLKLPAVDKDSLRGTGEDVLKKLEDKFTLGGLILKKRGLEKLLNTFVEAIPAEVSIKDKRLHAHFNPLGTDTGRFSSNQPNL